MKNKPDVEKVSRVTKNIAKVFEIRPEVSAVYLFGSVVMGMERKGSDLDIAVHLDDSLSMEQMGQYRFELIDILEQAVGSEVDLVVLNTASLKIISQVLRYGRLVYSESIDQARSYKLRKQREYFDFMYYLDRDIQEMHTFFMD